MDDRKKKQIALTLERLSCSRVSGYALLGAYLKMTGLRLSAPFEFKEYQKP